MSNPALEALLEAKIKAVQDDWIAKYGPAMDEWLWTGQFQPVLAEIGYNGTEVTFATSGISGLIDEMNR